MKKVLIMIDNLNGGGAEKVLVDILNNINYMKYNIDLFLIRKEGVYLNNINKNINLKYFLNKIGSKLKYFLKNKLYILTRKFPQLINLVIRKKYDISIAFLEGESTKFLSYKKGDKKKIAWVHTNLDLHKTFSKELEEYYYSKYNNIVCVSKDVKEVFDKRYPIFKERTEVIYNLIDKQEIINKSNLIKINLKNKSDINVIAVGRLVKEKGFDLLLKAHKILIDEKVSHNIYILGEGPERKNLEEQIKKYSLENSFFLLGFKENPYPFIKEADIFISSSRYEGFSLVVAEALILKKPVIATKCTGPLELLENGKYGVLINVNNSDELAVELKNMILNKERREFFSKKALERSQIFEKEEIMNKIENLFFRKKG